MQALTKCSVRFKTCQPLWYRRQQESGDKSPHSILSHHLSVFCAHPAAETDSHFFYLRPCSGAALTAASVAPILNLRFSINSGADLTHLKALRRALIALIALVL